MYDPRNRTMAPDDRGTKWKNCTKATAEELLESDLLSTAQRKMLKARVEKKSRNSSPSDRRTDETMSDYLERLGIVGVVID